MKKIYFTLLITFTIWGARLPSFRIPGIGNIYLIRALVIATIIYMFFALAKRKKIVFTKMQKTTGIFLFVTVIWSTLCFAWAPSNESYIASMFTYLTSFAILIITMQFIKEKEILNFCEKVFLLNVIVVLALAIYESFTGDYLILTYDSYMQQRNSLGLYKPLATFYNINNLGTFLALATPISCNAIFQFKKRKNICKFLFLMINTFVILLTNSRGALLAIIIFIILDFKNNFSTKKTILYGVILVITLLFFSTMLFESSLGELLTMDILEEGRIEIWKETLETISKYRFMGIGPGNTAYANLNSSHYKYTFGTPHNYFLEYLGDFGIICFAILIYWIYVLMKKSKYISLDTNKQWSYKAKNYYAYYIIFITLTICPSTMSTFQYLWLIFGFTIAMIDIYIREERNRKCQEQVNH